MENILVVDSHQEHAHYLTTHLAKEGYQVAVAFSSAEAIEKMQFTIFSLLFLALEAEMAEGKAETSSSRLLRAEGSYLQY